MEDPRSLQEGRGKKHDIEKSMELVKKINTSLDTVSKNRDYIKTQGFLSTGYFAFQQINKLKCCSRRLIILYRR